MRTLILSILACGLAFGTTITSNASGNWATGATWVGGVAPGNGDSAIIANGHTITIPISTSVTVGTSPTTSGTAAIATSSTSGTGKLIVNGTLIYKGPIDLSADTVVGPGAVLTHDSSGGADQTYTDLVIGGSGTTLTSAAHAFANTADGGKTLSITGGSGCTVQLIYIVSVTSAAALMSASPGTNGSTCTGTMLPNYFWRQSRTGGLNSTLFLNGTSGSRWTANIAAGSAPSGGFWTLPAVTDSGLVQAAYGDVLDCGLPAGPASTGDGYYCMFGAPITSGRVFSLDHVTFTRYARVGVGAVGTSTTTSITNNNFPSTGWQNFNNNCVEIGNGVLPITSVKTSGTRSFSGNYMSGCTLQIRASIASGGLKTGFAVSNNFFHNSGTTKIEISATTGPPVMQADEFQNNIFWHTGPDAPATQPSFNPPAGLLKRTYSLYDNTSNPGGTGATCSADQNYHAINTPPGTFIVQDWIFEPECATLYESNAALVLTAANWGSRFTATFRGNIWLPSNVGGGGYNPVLAYINSGLSSCNTSFWCPQIDYHHNTAYSGGPVPNSAGSGSGVGVGGEATGGTIAGMFTGIFANIWWQSTSRAGAIEGVSGIANASTTAGTWTGTNDYDWTYNQTGTLYAHAAATGAYTATPGTHNQSGDPSFVAPTRNFLGWCQTLNGADTSWAACEAHFALRGTSSDDSRYNGSDLVDWVRAGYRPNNRTTWNASPTGGYVGAIEVNTVTLSGKTTVSGGVTIK
jgi:hypothetical protein